MGAPTEHGATGKCDAWMIVNAALVGHFPQVFPQIEEKAEIGMRFSRCSATSDFPANSAQLVGGLNERDF